MNRISRGNSNSLSLITENRGISHVASLLVYFVPAPSWCCLVAAVLLYCLPYSESGSPRLTTFPVAVCVFCSSSVVLVLTCVLCAGLQHLFPVFNLEKIKLSEHFFLSKCIGRKFASWAIFCDFLTNFIWLLGQHNQNGKIEENIFLIKIENYFIGELCYQTKLLFDCSTFLFWTENPRRWL